ncbi:SAM-dependent methyltransferase [Nonomuraea sp. NN258]|uniref:SAM-dependent methyltransferase n=1 Tax=Nonomuraea antri TaxID=2730852 RepID=UPI00156A2B2C|nr:SAM-dependent methyltransferase [Nonomuraea antri]NRQ33001.1 SAM-dependent methyltransferase [Nonomuraea antri]
MTQGVNTEIPSPARIYDLWLGGTDNYEIDRVVSAQILAAVPELPVLARTNREFLGRAVRHLAREAGVRQFLDIGTGIPTAGNTHLVAQSVAPDSRVVYVDNDPTVVAQALLSGTPDGATAFVEADLREPEAILEAVAGLLDLDRPVGLMLLGVVDFLPGTAEAGRIIQRLLAALPSGSHLALSHGLVGKQLEEGVRHRNESGGSPLTLRTLDEVTGFFDGLELLEPGVVALPRWRPDPETLHVERESVYYAGVGRKP